MKVKFSRVIDYAYRQHKSQLPRAIKEFFGRDVSDPELEVDKEVGALFHEWLILDFQLSEKRSIAADYYLKNPDQLDQSFLEELKQILATQFYDLLEVMAVKKGQWLEVYSFAKGRTLRLWDKAGSRQAAPKTTITGRAAKIGNRWYLVGSNIFQFPICSTARRKRLLREIEDGFKFTPQDALAMVSRNDFPPQPPPRFYSSKELKHERKMIAKKFAKLARKYVFRVDFERVTDFVYREDYRTNFGDMLKDLVKLGIPEEAVFNSVSLFQDIWNFFPHRSLSGKCPVEMRQTKRR